MVLHFTPEQDMLRKTVADLAKKEFTWERERELETKEDFPHDYFSAMASIGLMALAIPEQYGGVGGSIVDLTIVTEEVARGSTSAANAYLTCVFLGGLLVLECGSNAQRSAILPALARGEVRCSTGITEPNAGSDAASVQTTARFDGRNYIVNGQKIFITGASVADYIFTVVRTDPSLPKHRGLSIIVVPRGVPGLSTRPMEKVGGRGVATCAVYFDDVVIAPDQVLGGEDCVNQGWRQLLAVLDDERITSSGFFTGQAQRAMELAVGYSTERIQFGRPIGSFQSIRHMLADMATNLMAGRLMTYHVARLKERGESCSQQAAMAKLFTSEMSKKTALDGLQILGGFGYMLESPMQMIVRDTLVNTIAAGTSQVQRNIIANGLGLPRE